jgi:hypothetical protein
MTGETLSRKDLFCRAERIYEWCKYTKNFLNVGNVIIVVNVTNGMWDCLIHSIFSPTYHLTIKKLLLRCSVTRTITMESRSNCPKKIN